jgi:pseudouridylate synthase
MKLTLSDEISGAIHFDRSIVALESTVISHGLPHPRNVETAVKMETAVREANAIPATIAVIEGRLCVGLSYEQIEEIGGAKDLRKISRRDLAIAVARKWSGATTVSSTMLIAHEAGIRVFATGGIGGVHRGDPADVSADLPELSNTPMTVVCSGPKAILDIRATREWLETHGVSVVGWKCDEMPAFYSRTSGLPVDVRVESLKEIAKIIETRNELGIRSALLVVVPVPEQFEIEIAEVERLISESMRAAKEHNVSGRDLTPFLLSEMASRSEGRTLEANIALLENNARLAAHLANAL